MPLPYYEPVKDKIIGATEGSIFYRHEQGHQRSWKLGIEPQLQMYSWMCIELTIALLGILSGYFFITLVSVIPLILSTYSELYAWYFAFLGYRFVKEKKREEVHRN
jgi:hypothetical protein